MAFIITAVAHSFGHGIPRKIAKGLDEIVLSVQGDEMKETCFFVVTLSGAGSEARITTKAGTPGDRPNVNLRLLCSFNLRERWTYVGIEPASKRVELALI